MQAWGRGPRAQAWIVQVLETRGLWFVVLLLSQDFAVTEMVPAGVGRDKKWPKMARRKRAATRAWLDYDWTKLNALCTRTALSIES